MRLAVRATPASEHVLQRARDAHGGTLRVLDRSPYAPLAQWSINGPALVALLQRLRPHLRLKRTKADALLLCHAAARHEWRPTQAELREIVQLCSTARSQPLGSTALDSLHLSIGLTHRARRTRPNGDCFVDYLAGFVDGDGSLGLHSNGRGGRLPVVTITQRRSAEWSDLVAEAASHFGGQEFMLRSPATGFRWASARAPHSRWRRSGQGALAVLLMVVPHLRLRRAEGDLLLRSGGLWWFSHGHGPEVDRVVAVMRRAAHHQPIETVDVDWLPTAHLVGCLLSDPTTSSDRSLLATTRLPSAPRIQSTIRALTPTETQLIAALRPAGRIITHRALCGRLWGRHDSRSRALLRRHICNIHKRRPDLKITPLRGLGVRLERTGHSGNKEPGETCNARARRTTFATDTLRCPRSMDET